jgi:hypothetical protein
MQFGTLFAFSIGMHSNFRVVINKYAAINFAASEPVQEDLDGSVMRLKVPADELARLLEKDMVCEMETLDKGPMSLRIREISRNNGSLILNCIVIK